MAIYISIDESYAVYKLKGMDGVLKECAGRYTRDGRVITKKVAQEELKDGSFNAYQYDEDELIEAKERGSCIGVDWAVKIQKI